MSSLSDGSRENLITEIRLLRSLNHKYIVTLEDFFWDDKNIYIVLEYCNAGSLSTFIRSKKSLPEATCKYFLRQLAAAVQYMRSNDICHFDLKPQNLLLTKVGTNNVCLKVADFGFAQHLKLGEINMQLKGSPLYMAPEIVLKHQYDARADLWSIGVILYECLFGRAPYSSKTLEELLMRIRSCEKINLPPNSRISKECEDLLSCLLQHDPSKRISFKDFFNHAFLDLKTFPSEKVSFNHQSKKNQSWKIQILTVVFHFRLYKKPLSWLPKPWSMMKNRIIKRPTIFIAVLCNILYH